MSYLKLQQISSKSIHTLPSDNNMDASSGQSQLYATLSWLFPVIALILFAITRMIQVNSKSAKSEEKAKYEILHKNLDRKNPINRIYKN